MFIYKRKAWLGLLALCLGLLLIAAPTYAQQPPQPVISINPTSGPPGTVVTITGNIPMEQCYFNGNPMGGMSGATVYNVPLNATGNISFYCTANGVSSNTVTFVLAQPTQEPTPEPEFTPSISITPTSGPPGTVITIHSNYQFEQCYFNGNSMGPTVVYMVPQNATTNITFYCSSNIRGTILESNRVTFTLTGISVSTVPPPPPTDIPTPTITLPTTGPCVIATRGGAVNVRQLPTTESEILTRLQGQTVYQPTGQTLAPDGTWYQIFNGWVASFVVDTGGAPGACNSLPTISTQPDPVPDPPTPEPPTATPEPEVAPPVEVTLADNNIDLNNVLADCPEVLPEALKLPVFVQLELASGLIAFPCDYVQGILADLIFEDVPQLSPENVDAILANCPEVLPILSGVMDRLYSFNQNAWSALDGVMTPENACDLAEAIARNEIPAEFLAALGASANIPRSFVASYSSAPLAAPASAALIDVRIAMCAPAIVDPALAIILRERLLAEAVDETLMINPATACPLIQIFLLSGNFSPAQEALKDIFLNTCGLDVLTTYQMVYGTISLGTDILTVLTISPAVLCADPITPLTTILLDPLTDPNVPASLAACPTAFAMPNHNASIRNLSLWIILRSIPATACALSANFVQTGSIGIAMLPEPIPPCYDNLTDTFTLAGGFVIDQNTPWVQKIAALDRADVCALIDPPIPDTDGDGVPDDLDACPLVFAITPNGCPTNNAPEISPIAPQVVMLGGLIDVGVTVTDLDGDPVTLNAVSADGSIAGVIVDGHVLKVNGAAVGDTSIGVTASDGIDSSPIVSFTVSVVAPPAPNNPPTVDPIPNQGVLVGQSINIGVIAIDPDGDPLTVSAFAANGAIAGVNVIGTTVTVTGLAGGSTTVTVIANDGSATGGTSFTVSVQAPLPPAPPPPPPPPGDPAPLSPVVSEAVSLNEAALSNALVDLSAFEDVPKSNATNVSAVFQASPADDLSRSMIYILLNGKIEPLFEGTEENYWYPALSADGQRIAYLAQSPEGELDLRVLRLDRGIALTLLSDQPDAPLGLFPPAWSPEGDQLLFTRFDAQNIPSIFRLDLTNPRNIPEPELLITNATTASVAPNGRYIAFERIDENGESNIIVVLVRQPGAESPITNQPLGSACSSPMFGTDSLSLFFACASSEERRIFRYGIEGVAALDVPVEDSDNPTPGPGATFIAFDDGTIIYYGYADGSNVAPMVQVPGQRVSHIRWLTLNAME